VVEDLAEDVGLLDLAGGVRLARLFEGVERGTDGRVVGQVQAG
jgi:hypothetical protein